MNKKTTLTATLPDGTIIKRTTHHDYLWVSVAFSDGCWGFLSWHTQRSLAEGKAQWARNLRFNGKPVYEKATIVPVNKPAETAIHTAFSFKVNAEDWQVMVLAMIRDQQPKRDHMLKEVQQVVIGDVLFEITVYDSWSNGTVGNFDHSFSWRDKSPERYHGFAHTKLYVEQFEGYLWRAWGDTAFEVQQRLQAQIEAEFDGEQFANEADDYLAQQAIADYEQVIAEEEAKSIFGNGYVGDGFTEEYDWQVEDEPLIQDSDDEPHDLNTADLRTQDEYTLWVGDEPLTPEPKFHIGQAVSASFWGNHIGRVASVSIVEGRAVYYEVETLKGHIVLEPEVYLRALPNYDAVLAPLTAERPSLTLREIEARLDTPNYGKDDRAGTYCQWNGFDQLNPDVR